MRLTWLVALALCALSIGCTSEETDDDPCGISGTWAMTYTLGGGTCFTPGGVTSDVLTFTLIGEAFTAVQADGDQLDGVLDQNRCTMVLTDADVIPETATTFEIRLVSTETLTFDLVGGVDSTVAMSADLYEAGAMVNTCLQSASGNGLRQ